MFLAIFVGIHVPLFGDVREAEEHHQIIDKTNVDSEVEHDVGYGDLLAETMGIGGYDALAETEEEFHEAILEGHDQAWRFHQVFLISILSKHNFNALLSSVGIETLFDFEPLVFKLFIESSNFIP